MSLKTVYVCDSCGEHTEDYKKEKGWLVFFEGLNLDITGIGDTAISKCVDESAHFCSIECFLRWAYGALLRDMDIHLDIGGLYE